MVVKLPFEMEFILCLTYRCNLCCSMCTQYGEGFKNDAPVEMPVKEWLSFFNSIADVEPKPKLLLMGGEPLLYPDFDVLLRAAGILVLMCKLLLTDCFWTSILKLFLILKS